MAHNTIDAPQSATGTDAATNLEDRQTTLNNYIIANSLALTEAAFYAAKYQLFFTAPEAILATLYGNLHRYGGPVEETAFLKWANRFVAKEASRYEITGRILTEYEDLIFDAIRQSLWTSAQDWAIEPKDVFWEVALLIFQRAHSFDKPDKAKLSTRIYSLVKKHVYLYYNKKTRDRFKSVRLRQNELRCEHFSEDELNAMRAAEKEEGVYDPGYAEAGLQTA
ncbi:MAG: hypothetical protein HIU91_10080 [Acidobacteria bacterium]|nr:hypothetical protein [Acidobacteriota bacterium]